MPYPTVPVASPVGSAGHPEVVEDVEVEVSPVDVEDVDVASVVTVVEVCSVVVALRNEKA